MNVTELDLMTDKSRSPAAVTEIFVRAKDPETGEFVSADIAELSTISLFKWLRSRGGANQWAEDCVLRMLGHQTSAKELEERWLRSQG